MAITSCVPIEIYTYQILSFLTACETHRFSQVSKKAHEIVVASASAPQEDIDLSGERVTIWLDGSIAAYLLHKIKMDTLARQPTLLDHLRSVRDATIAAGHDPKDIKSLFREAFQFLASEPLPLFFLFDFNTKLLPEFRSQFGSALHRAISANNPELVKAVLFHPNATNIKLEALESGLRQLEEQKIGNEDKLKILKILFSHPNAANISVEVLQHAMCAAVQRGHVEFLRELFSHSNAANIPAKDISYEIPVDFFVGTVRYHLGQGRISSIIATRYHAGTGLEGAFKIALKQNNYELVQLILDQPNADQIEHPGLGACQIL